MPIGANGLFRWLTSEILLVNSLRNKIPSSVNLAELYPFGHPRLVSWQDNPSLSLIGLLGAY